MDSFDTFDAKLNSGGEIPNNEVYHAHYIRGQYRLINDTIYCVVSHEKRQEDTTQ